MKPFYRPSDLAGLADFFAKHGTFELNVKPNGLYSAVTADRVVSFLGYGYTWIRDTIMMTHYQAEIGRYAIARTTLATLRNYFDKHRYRFIEIIEGKADKNDPMRRPHIRFDGNTLEEIDEPWAHAQNDALGYALWMVFLLANRGEYPLTAKDCDVFALFPFYFERIEYWHDLDSGHWEETPKIESSSIGVVVAALEQMRRFLSSQPAAAFRHAGKKVTPAQLDELIARGREQLARLLPYESPPERLADAALLFLIYPAETVSDADADRILDMIRRDLQGEYGIRRYSGDSYWCADYKKLLREEERTADFSKDLERRDKLMKPGTEAQWCIFDPIVSVIYGRRYLKTGRSDDLQRQIHYFNRSLAQITPEDFALGGGQCPEAYYIEDSANGVYVPNDHVPLGWTQANLGTAFEYLKRSLRC
jgi:phosphorylase kinase alpha/beta subunit